MKYIIIFLTFALSLFLQVSIVGLPLVLVSLLFFGVLYKEEWIFLVAFFMGMLLDMLSFRVVGISSLFFLVTLGIVFLYERKFEIQSIPFLFFASFLAALFYGMLFSSVHIIWEALGVALISAGIFYVLALLNTKASGYTISR